ncbi:MAG: GNAT family N-acetyltransferase [Anaerolineaceae bacterium]
MSAINIREKSPHDIAWIHTLMLESWGSNAVVLQGRLYHPAELPAFIAEQNGERMGLVTYIFENGTCEIISLNSLQPGLGIGTLLMDAVKQIALKNGCTEMKLFTTNDNITALRFYQKFGFYLEALIKNGVASDRDIKPEIPLKADNSIPIRDYLLLKMRLKP